jgi:hypothetical protein
LVDKLGHRTPLEGNRGSTAGHRLYDAVAERFVKVDEVKERVRFSKYSCSVGSVDGTDVLHAIAVDVWRNLIPEVLLILNDAGNDEGPVGPARYLNGCLARWTMQSAATFTSDPVRILETLHGVVYRHDPDQFVSAQLLSLAPVEHGALRLDMALAGHPTALVRRGDRSVEQCGNGGQLLGMIDKPFVERVEVTLAQSFVMWSSSLRTPSWL